MLSAETLPLAYERLEHTLALGGLVAIALLGVIVGLVLRKMLRRTIAALAKGDRYCTGILTKLIDLLDFTKYDFPLLWDLLGYMFTPKMRDEVYSRVTDELKLDFYRARILYNTPLQKAYLFLCFTGRTILLVMQCGGVSFSRPFGRLIPEKWRKAWNLVS